MKLIDYKWTRGVLLLATTLALSSIPDSKIFIEREDKEQGVREILIKNKKNLEYFAVHLDENMSEDDVRKKIIELFDNRIKREVNEILKETEFKVYDPLSDVKLKKLLENSYEKPSGLTKLASNLINGDMKKFIRVREEWRIIQNNVLENVYEDVKGGLSALAEKDLEKYYIKVVDYEKFINLNSDIYELIINNLNKKDVGPSKLKEWEEKKEFTKRFFEKEGKYIKSIYNKS